MNHSRPGMRCSWPRTCIKVFRPYLHRGGSRAGQKIGHGGSPSSKNFFQTRRLQQQTKYIAMILKHVRWSVVVFGSILKSNFLCFHCSQISDSGPLGLLFRLLEISPSHFGHSANRTKEWNVLRQPVGLNDFLLENLIDIERRERAPPLPQCACALSLLFHVPIDASRLLSANWAIPRLALNLVTEQRKRQ